MMIDTNESESTLSEYVSGDEETVDIKPNYGKLYW